MKPASSDILLEAGTNELELLEFGIGESRYGINVAKVRELLQYQPIQPIPHAQACVEGVISPRNELLTVINLAAYLGHPPSQRVRQDIFLITEFNRMSLAFHVHQVMGIHRISWVAIEKPNSAVFGGRDGVVTGIAKVNSKLISILDFEKIMVDVSPGSSVESDAALIHSPDQADTTHRILLAEDSMMLRKMIMDALRKAGYENIVAKDDGQEAWDYLQQLREEDGPAQRQVSCVITDIEMPKMDGHHLTRRIKQSKALSGIPVIIFSSLITDEMMLKGEEVGADAQLSKPQIHLLVDRLAELI